MGIFLKKKQLFFEDKTFVKIFEGAGKECLRERRKRHFRGCCTGGKKCVNLQVIVPGRFGARKKTQENILGHIRTRQNAQ